ncbi:Possible purine/pyrimidine phosphoribosyltransferase [hydrothermal vent metagenome]|uniref:Possible purine/pyrimidine phosphoribosyltransferase n=1 Tax=hydrothermal vent metagenome TaxID=652676 RepID=A0A1W1EET1_9ZZZZ
MKEFIENNDGNVYIIGVDENVLSGYSHVSILTKSMEMNNSIPQHSKLIAKTKVNYSGKSLKFRLENPRDFVYDGKEDVHAILVDDIVTTGITLQEAQKVLMQHGVNVLFALTLANVEEL